MLQGQDDRYLSRFPFATVGADAERLIHSRQQRACIGPFGGIFG